MQRVFYCCTLAVLFLFFVLTMLRVPEFARKSECSEFPTKNDYKILRYEYVDAKEQNQKHLNRTKQTKHQIGAKHTIFRSASTPSNPSCYADDTWLVVNVAFVFSLHFTVAVTLKAAHRRFCTNTPQTIGNAC